MQYPGKLLQRGSTGDAVKAIQKALSVQQTGLFGPTTEEIVTNFQRAHGLDPDGVVGPRTWAALFAPAPAATRDVGETALRIARGYVGQHEQPLGSNRGPFVDECNRIAGVPAGSFWCMAFVYRCVTEAVTELGLSAIPMPRTASCSALYRWARDNGRLVSRPEPGDIFLCIGGELGHYHTGFVVKLLANERFSTVEGNSNDDGSANGIEVASRPNGRRLSSCHYVRL
jgi:hypothetical protein